jgi:hypothetical protein
LRLKSRSSKNLNHEGLPLAGRSVDARIAFGPTAKYWNYAQIELTRNGDIAIVGGPDMLSAFLSRGLVMLRCHRNVIVVTLLVCALSSRTVLAKRHHKPHKGANNSSSGTLSLGTTSYQGLATVSAGTLLVAPPSYQGLIINSGYEALVASSAGTLTLANLYQGSTTISTGTLTIGNFVTLEPSNTLVSNNTLILSGSAGVLSVELSKSLSSMGTLQINNAANYFGDINLTSFQQLAGGLTVLASSNLVIPSDAIFVPSGTLSPNVPEPAGLGLLGIGLLAFLRRHART